MSKERSVESVKLEEGAVGTPISGGDDLITPDDESRYITGLKLYLINTGLIISMFLVQMDSSMLVSMYHLCCATKLTTVQYQHGSSRHYRSPWRLRKELVAIHGVPYHLLQYVSSAPHLGRTLITHPHRYIHDISKNFRHLWTQARSIDMSGHLHALLSSVWSSADDDTTHHVPMVSGCRRRRCLRSGTTHVLGACATKEASSIHGHFSTRFVVGHWTAPWRWHHAAWKLAMDLPCQVSFHKDLRLEVSLTSSISVPVGVLAGLALCFTLPRTAWNEPAADPNQDRSLSTSFRRLDFLGAILMLGAIVLLTTGLQQTAEGYAWDSPMVLGLVISFAPMVIAFFIWQWYATTRRTNPEPVFPWRLCQDRRRIGMIM
jgi:hypothetical protein